MTPTPPPPSATAGLAKDELNLAEFPITLLDDRHRKGEMVLEFSDAIRDPRTGAQVERKLTVSASAAHGLPTSTDDEVLLGLIMITKRANFAERKVHFSRHQLIQLLRWPDKGASYHRVEESLQRWKGVSLDYVKAWWDPLRERWVSEGFHVIDNYGLYEEDDRRPGLPYSWFTWNDVIFRSFQSGYVRTIDLDFYLGLRTPVAKRLYRFLGKRFYHGGRWEFDLRELAFEHVGLSRSYHNGVIKQRLAAAIRELEEKGFLAAMPDGERFVKRRRGEWRAVFLAGKGEAAAVPPARALPAEAPPASPLVALLIARGVTAAAAALLEASHPADRVAAQVEVLDWLTEQGDKRASKNPAGWLVKAIRDDYQPPKGYRPKAERESQQAAAAEAERGRREQANSARRLEEQEDARRRGERRHVERVLQGMGDGDREALGRRAVAAATAEERDRLKDDLFGEIMKRVVVERQLLCEHPFRPGSAEAA